MSDILQLDDTVTIPNLDVQIVIRTKHYPEASSGDHYETFAFSRDSKWDGSLIRGWVFRRRYGEEKDARKGHQELIEFLETGMWELVPVEWKIKRINGADRESPIQKYTEEITFSGVIENLERIYNALPPSMAKMTLNMTMQDIKQLKEMRNTQ